MSGLLAALSVGAILGSGPAHAIGGQVFSFGDNGSGRACFGPGIEGNPEATGIDDTNLGGHNIVQIEAGSGAFSGYGNYSLLLGDDGTVFAFGSNADGRTGMGTTDGATLIPTAIDSTNLMGVSIEQVSAGEAHSLLLSDDGTVYAFGDNLFAATGLNTTAGDTLVATPIDTSQLGASEIIGVSAGDHHSLLLADGGLVFSFGSNIATGQGTYVGSTLVATPINQTNLAGRDAIAISAGRMHSMIITVPEASASLAAAAALAALAALRLLGLRARG